MQYYLQESFLNNPIGNNMINFDERKKLGSDCSMRIPPLMQCTIDDVKIVTSYESGVMSGLAYEYVDEKGRLISDFGLQNLIQMNKKIYIVDNHNHAFYCRWKAYSDGYLQRGSHLIHIDQHSDLNEIAISSKPQVIGEEGEAGCLMLDAGSKLKEVAIYTNEILDIASFIKPAKEIGLITDYEMILTEYALLQHTMIVPPQNGAPGKKYPRGGIGGDVIIDIDLDFRAPEMSIQEYDATIKRVRQLIALPTVGCVTIATSPTYISQHRALEVLSDILQ